jgi:hypothetical protein
MEVSSQLHAPVAAFPGEKAPRYPLDRRQGDHRAGLEAVEKRKKILILPEIEPRQSNP